MKKQIKYTAAALLVAAIGLSSCTDSFEKYNNNEAGFPDELKEADYNKYGISLKVVQQGVYFNYDWGSGKNWPYQVMQNLGADMFSGYMHDFNPFNDGMNNSCYYMMDGWNNSFWDNTYGYILTELKKSEMLTQEKYPSFYGITKILRVEVMHRVADIYGPIIYTKFGVSTGSMPDTQAEAYDAFFKDLDLGVQLIQTYMEKNPGMENFAKFDMLMPKGKKNYAQWLKFANSLRLRLAVRVAVVDPVRAQSEIQKALDPKYGGVLEASSDLVAVSTDNTGFSNPLGVINQAWGEVFMNANMESILLGCEDPRLEKYFIPAVSKEGSLNDNGENLFGTPVVDYYSKFKGIRQGTGFKHTNYGGHSKSTISAATDAVLMTAAEVWFLRAEVALRGWSAENAGECYKNGVTASFSQWGAEGASDYLESTKTPADYLDAFDAANNIKAVSTCSPKWDDAATKEQMLEKIITQKWLATYPEGCEAWTEQRRTGYPKLFPVKANESKGTIDTDIMIRRFNFSVTIISANKTQYDALIVALGDKDNCGTRLWWDTGRNF